MNARIIRPGITETTAKGAAMLAGLAVGFWKTLAELKETLCVEKTFFPQMKNTVRHRLYADWEKALDKYK